MGSFRGKAVIKYKTVMHISGKSVLCSNKNVYFVATLNSFYNTLLQLKMKRVNLSKQLKKFFNSKAITELQ